MSEVLVIGHRNPDTDAICSAIGYAEFKRRTGMTSAVAARCGDTNDRIDFVLQTFGIPAPRFVADVSPKVRDVMQTQVQSVRRGKENRGSVSRKKQLLLYLTHSLKQFRH